MNRRLAGISFAAVVAVIAGCSSTPSNKKIALQIEPNHQQDQPLAADLNPKPRTAEPAAQSATPSPATPTFLPPAPDAKQTERQTATYAKLLESAAAARHSATQPGAVNNTIASAIDPSQLRIGASDANANPSPDKTGATEDRPPMRIAPLQANAGASIDITKPQDGSNAPLSVEPVESKASAVLTPTDTFETRITRRLKDYPRDISANLDYQLLLFLRDEPVPQLSSITPLPTEDRELISSVMDGLSNFRSTLRADNNMLFSRKIHPLTEMTDRLRTQAELSVPTLLLCSKVTGFGQYDPMEPRFRAQQEKQAIVYCELENFSSQQNAAKMWQTDITEEAVLYTEDGMQVWANKTLRVQDQCRDRRHDFFLPTLVTFPGTLTMGRYMLKVTIVDSQANRVAEASLPIEVTAQ
jgi:hypothetical protein